jgi:hypothetical protein
MRIIKPGLSALILEIPSGAYLRTRIVGHQTDQAIFGTGTQLFTKRTPAARLKRFSSRSSAAAVFDS